MCQFEGAGIIHAGSLTAAGRSVNGTIYNIINGISDACAFHDIVHSNCEKKAYFC